MSAGVKSAGGNPAPEVLLSSDSHVMESGDLWLKRLPASLRERAPRYAEEPEKNAFAQHDGGRDPAMRVQEMAADGVSAEVLYPTRALDQFAIEDPVLQEACFRVYNDWLQEYCSVAPERLFGIPCIEAYRAGPAVKEIERAKRAGARGIMIWQTPPAEHSFATRHHDPIWEAAQALELPVSLHILCGTPFPSDFLHRKRTATEFANLAVTDKLAYCMKALVDIIVSGVLDRFPRLKVVLVENEVSWLPFFITQLDKYTGRKYRAKIGPEYQIERRPSEYFGRNVFATFFNDQPAGVLMEGWGADTWMWSNDFPHPNSTWPKSREIIRRHLSGVSEGVRAKLVRDNCARVYNLETIPALA